MLRVYEAVSMLAGGLSGGQESALEAYMELVRNAGRRWNLLSPKALAGVAEHVLDSAAVLQVWDEPDSSVADLGSGAGLPGVVVAILRPGLRVSLVDSRRSKVVFLREAVRVLNLENVEVVHERLQGLAGAAFDVALSRALGSVEKTLAPSLGVIRRGGRLILYKGPRWGEERASALAIAQESGASIVLEQDVTLPGLSRATRFVVFGDPGNVAGRR